MLDVRCRAKHWFTQGGVFGKGDSVDGGVSLNPALFVAVEEILCLGVLVGATGNEINPDKDNEGDNEDNVGLPPFFAEVGEEAGLAGVAVIAEVGLVIAPQVTVRVSHGVGGIGPHYGVHVAEPTCRWRLTAP